MSEGALPASLDNDILFEAPRNRDIHVVEGYTHAGARSHVLLAACRETEIAFEDNERGYFTR